MKDQLELLDSEQEAIGVDFEDPAILGCRLEKGLGLGVLRIPAAGLKNAFAQFL